MPGMIYTVATWLTTWYEVYAEPRLRPNTKLYYQNYIDDPAADFHGGKLSAARQLVGPGPADAQNLCNLRYRQHQGQIIAGGGNGHRDEYPGC